MAKEREFVMLDSFDKYTDDALVDVLAQLEEEAESAIAEVRAENKRRSEVAIKAALERAERAGVSVVVPEQKEPAKKRGRKSNAAKAAEEAAVDAEDSEPQVLSNGHSQAVVARS